MTRSWSRLLTAGFILPFLAMAQNRGERIDGFIPMVWNAEQGKLLFELTQFDTDVLYFSSVAKGGGSGSVGLEVAGGGEGGVIQFHRVGPKVLVVERNLEHRAANGNAALAAGVETSFPDSILASLPVVESADGKVIVDATAFVIRDAAGFARGGGRGGNGASWQFDANRSAIYLPRTKGFPKNTEIEVTVTYQSQSGGARTTPESNILTARLHYSFVEPPTGYVTRKADPRIGVISMGFADYSQPTSNSTRVELVRRHRLEKADPTVALSDPIEPIVYYLDASVPEPTRSAIKDGVLWWNKGFEAAGFTNALEIRDTPPDMDPMDIRYNHIFWVNRDERGYSTGGGISDPRTGEMISARVRLESDRVRTVSGYWQTYRPPVTGGAGGAQQEAQEEEFFAQLPPYATPETEEQLVLLREALLAAHEVGHSLGFEHNWAASMNDRASVMDYPSPRIKLVDGRIDLTDAYQTSIGAYDSMALRYAYTVFPSGKEDAGLESIIGEMRAKGLFYVPSSDPRWNRYDDLNDPAEFLRASLAQRKVLLGNYGPKLLAPGEPYGNLRGMRLWMTYLHHRWGIDTSVRYIGGLYQNYVVKGETLPPTEIVPAAKQREILGLLLESLAPEQLAIPEDVLSSLTVSVAGGPSANSNLENFTMATGPAFDQLSAARVIAGLVLGQLLEPEKAARLISFADRQANALTLPEVLAAATNAIWGKPASGSARSLQRQVQRVHLESLMTLAANRNATPDVKAVVMSTILALHKQIAGMNDRDAVTEAHLRQAERDLARFIEDPTAAPPSSAPAPPVMAPI